MGADWWNGAVIYQIYPRSFMDASGDGVGDLPGILQRLEYVADLGVDAVWISPFCKSPMKDFGYDVADYRAVDPLFGTMDDFRAVLERAHVLGLKVMIDQVLSHTSDQHAWFIESRADRTNPKADWYVWADPKPDGSPPNNWLAVFGGSSWQWEPRRGQYYLHNFLREQPDLNFHEREVQEAVLDVCRFWLDEGVDGFRLDVAAYYFHDPSLADNPPNPEPPTGAFRFNPYAMQVHRHDIDQPETLAFLERMRALADGYGAVLLGELHEEEGCELHRAYVGPGRLHLAYGYWLLGAERLDAAQVRRLAQEMALEPGGGGPSWAIDNHDFVRSASRLGGGEASFVLFAALACLPGATCLFQGQELGLPQAEVPFERLVDPYGREFWPAYKGRDGVRTPMPWHTEAPNAGFSAAKPWLPIPAQHLALASEVQARAEDSPLSRMRRFLAWRRERPHFRGRALEWLEAPPGVLAFRRGSEALAFNLSSEPAEFVLAEQRIALPSYGGWLGGYPL